MGGLWGTSTTLLDGTDLSSPSSGLYHYVEHDIFVFGGASLRRVQKKGRKLLRRTRLRRRATKRDGTFSDTYGVSETVDDFELDCEASGGPNGIEPTYVWTHIAGSGLGLLSATDTESHVHGAVFIQSPGIGKRWNTSTITVPADKIELDIYLIWVNPNTTGP